jgi:methionine-rich copper-binding protein CopC
MTSTFRGGLLLGAIVLTLGLLVVSTSQVFAHARFDRAEPPANSALDGSPFVLKALFTQELTSRSTIRVLDANGVQVDLGDGHVDLDDPDRKVMYVSLPELPVGVYTVESSAESAEDGHTETETFMFGVGMIPSGAEQPAAAPVDAAPAEAAPAAVPPAQEAPAGPAEPWSARKDCDRAADAS